MEEVFNDSKVLEAFPLGQLDPLDPWSTRVPALDWVEDRDYPLFYRIAFDDLANSRPLLRVLFPPLNLPNTPYAHGLLQMVRDYSIPSAFLEGPIRGVTHSFGSLDSSDGYRSAWFNYLCKNITVEDHGSGPFISDPRSGVEKTRHGDFTWIKAGFFLRWAVGSNADPHLTLLCFGGNLVQQRLQRLSFKAVRDGVARDPLSLFVIILHELSFQMDCTASDLSRVFGEIEYKALNLVRQRESFTGLHNVSKHMIYLQESSEAVLMTMKNIAAYHEDLFRDAPGQSRANYQVTQTTIKQVEAEFQTIRLRLKSLDRRMQNVIALSFHLVTQEGNELLQADSNTMATIAFVTLIFLPITTVATIFGSEFFNTSVESSSLEISKDFWVFWACSIPLTLGVLMGWCVFRGRHPGAAFHEFFRRRAGLGKQGSGRKLSVL